MPIPQKITQDSLTADEVEGYQLPIRFEPETGAWQEYARTCWITLDVEDGQRIEDMIADYEI